MARLVEHLCSKQKALNTNSCTAKKQSASMLKPRVQPKC
jgi:hypothetical protein